MRGRHGLRTYCHPHERMSGGEIAQTLFLLFISAACPPLALFTFPILCRKPKRLEYEHGEE